MNPFNPVIPEKFMENLNPVPFYRHEHGQVKAESPFGIALAQCALKSETIVEIGTWHGEGSTVCLARGMVRPTQRLISLETDDVCVANARAYHAADSRIIIVHGAIVLASDQRQSLLISVSELPEKIDLLLIDGSDLTGQKELELLHDRCQMVALDDVREYKNKANFAQLTESKWSLIYSGEDRNGWAIFQRP